MTNVEQEEAKKILDQLAREIHGIYGTHAAGAGLKTPKWEELPESAKSISRDISRLVLAKMQEAYNEGKKASPRTEATVSLPRSWSPEDAIKVLDAFKPKLDDLVSRIGAEKRAMNSPFGRGLDEAISALTKKLALEILTENPELLAKLRQMAEAELVRVLSDDEKEEA